MRIATLIVVSLLVLTLGCGESAEHKLEQAKIALNSGRPDSALTYAQAVLTERPNDQAAMFLMAKAHLRLRHYEDSRQLLKKLVAIDPAQLETRRELLNLVLAEMTDLLTASEFNTNAALADRFTNAKELGHEQVDWLVSDGKEVATGEYIRARLLIFDSQRIGRLVREEETRIRSEATTRDPNSPVSTAALEEQRRQIKGLLQTAEKHLELALAADPGNFPAAGILSRLFRSREAWSDLWVLVGKLESRTDLPAPLVADIVADLLVMPDRLYTEAVRLQACRKLMAAVSEQGRASVQWKIMRARLHLRDREKEQAMELAQEVFRSQPADVEARLTYAWCLYETAQFPPAKTILESLAAEQRDHEHVQLLYGLTLVQTGDLTLAAEALRRTTDINPNNQIARTAFVKLLAETRDSVSAVLEDINKLYQANPGDPDAIRFKFIAEVAAGSAANVKALLASVETISPRQPGHIRVLMDGQIYLKNPVTAMAYARDWVNAEPDRLEPYMALARVHLMQNQLDDARRVLVSLQDKFPDSPAVNETLAQLYLNQGSFDRAIEISKAIITETPDNHRARLILAYALSQLSLTEEALEQTKAILDRQPDEPRALEMTASIYRMIGQADLAQAYLEKIDESKIDETKLPGVLAQLKLQKGDLTEAMAICNRAVAAGSADPLVRLTIASIHHREKNVGEEEIHLVAFVRENPGLYVGYLMLSRFYSVQNVERGISQFRTFRSLNESLARLSEASLLNTAGRREEALSVLAEGYGQVINERQRIALTYARAMASLIVARPNWRLDQLKPIYDALIDADLYGFDARIAWVDMSWDQADPATQVQRLDEATKALKTNELEKIKKLVDRYQRMRQFDKAVAAVEFWITKQPKNTMLITTKGDVLANALKSSEAMQAYKEALVLDPESIDIHERLAHVQRSMHDFPAVEVTLAQMAKIGTGARIRALWAQVDLYTDLGLPEQARLVIEDLAKASNPDDPRVLFALGQSMIMTGDSVGARSRLTLIPKHASNYGQAQLALVRLDETEGKSEEVRRRLEQLLTERIGTVEAIKVLIEWGIRNRDFPSILKWSERAVQMDQADEPTRLRWLKIRSVAQASTGDHNGLEKTFQQIMALEPTPSNRAATIAILVYLGRREEATKLYTNDPAFPATDHGVLLSLALGRPIDAKAQARPLTHFLLALAAGDTARASAAAKMLGAVNNTVYASDLIEQCSQLKLGSPEVLEACRKIAVALVALETGVPPLAERLAMEVGAVQPQLTLAHAIALASAIAQEKPIEAVRARILAQVPNSTLAKFVQLHSESADRQWAKAIDLAKSILEREPGHDHLTQRLITLYKLTEDNENAMALTRKLAASKGPFRDMAANDLAYHLSKQGGESLEEARRIAMELRRKYPLDANMADTLGWIEHLRGDKDAALRNLSFSITRMNHSPDVHYHIGATYQSLGNMKWARLHLNAAVAKGKGSPVSLAAAELLKTIPQNAPAGG